MELIWFLKWITSNYRLSSAFRLYVEWKVTESPRSKKKRLSCSRLFLYLVTHKKRKTVTETHSRARLRARVRLPLSQFKVTKIESKKQLQAEGREMLTQHNRDSHKCSLSRCCCFCCSWHAEKCLSRYYTRKMSNPVVQSKHHLRI